MHIIKFLILVKDITNQMLSTNKAQDREGSGEWGERTSTDATGLKGYLTTLTKRMSSGNTELGFTILWLKKKKKKGKEKGNRKEK